MRVVLVSENRAAMQSSCDPPHTPPNEGRRHSLHRGEALIAFLRGLLGVAEGSQRGRRPLDNIFCSSGVWNRFNHNWNRSENSSNKAQSTPGSNLSVV